ncbi:MAG: D-alanyl-D-alanine carboxypeptidase [Alphaproteobacteria bacterium]|nr:D-alanyl-D-alanine carboxypeptidase [Alphaproteobacteria bacterium]
MLKKVLALSFVFALMGTTAAHAIALVSVDLNRGQIVRAMRAEQQYYPASLVKMMTLYVAFGAMDNGWLEVDQELPISRFAATRPRSRLGLHHGYTIKARDAMIAMAVRSANDATVVLAEALGETEAGFVKIMNQVAQDLGMKDTVFRNSTGLHHPEQKTTARDMATLALALNQHFPHYYSLFSVRNFAYNGVRYGNSNLLLFNFPGADGLKTGFTSKAGYNLAATATRDGRKVLVIGMGYRTAAQRNREIHRLLGESFEKDSAHFADAPQVIFTEPSLMAFRPVITASIARVRRESEQILARLEHGYGYPHPRLDETTSWGIQVGATRYPANAQQLADEARRRQLGHMSDLITRVDTSTNQQGRTLFLAQLYGFADRNEAVAACRRVRAGQRNQNGCFVTPPVRIVTVALHDDGSEEPEIDQGAQ